MRTIEIGLTTEPFEELLERGEGVDIRLNEPKWGLLRLGDHIRFVEDPGGARFITVEIVELNTFISFEELYRAYEKWFPGGWAALSQHLYQWWSKPEEKHFGALAIKVRMVK